MKTKLVAFLLCAWLPTLSAQEKVAPEETEEKSRDPQDSGPRKLKLENWGVALDFAKDCDFKVDDGKLTITVPGGGRPHDLSTELLSATAPRILQPASGDFSIQVKIEGQFEPGEESSQPGRTGYTGAGIVVFADAKNYVRLERATLQHVGEKSSAYTNFEIRVDGDLERIGMTNDAPLDASKPTWLRLQRKGNRLFGAVSQDGVNWKEALPKDLLHASWKKETLVGLAAISTSAKTFKPTYSEFSLQSKWVDPVKPAEAAPEPGKLEK
jgi:regulation of enolase protein 1 (concanavalin A-like superfamily)